MPSIFRINLSLSPLMLAQVKALATAETRSLSSMAAVLIGEALRARVAK